MACGQALIVSAGQERTISLWDLRQPLPVLVLDSRTRGMHRGEVTSLCLSHKGEILASGGDDGMVKLWRVQDGGGSVEWKCDLPGHTGRVSRLAFSADDLQLVSAGHDGGVFVWNVYE